MAETKFISELIGAKKLTKHRIDDIRTAFEKDMLDKFDADIFKQLVMRIRVLPDREQNAFGRALFIFVPKKTLDSERSITYNIEVNK